MTVDDAVAATRSARRERGPDRRGRVRRLRGIALVASSLLVLAGPVGEAQAVGPATAAPARVTPAAVAPASMAAPSGPPRFVREVVRPGAVDADPYNIAHVYELQYRLKRLGFFAATPTGYYGSVTRRAVLRFKKRNGLGTDAVVGPKAWRLLIPRSVRGRAAVPDACREAGWHACYDRSRHQVNLYRAGTLVNSWLVRGGSYYTPTRTGDYTVYYRDIDHVSSKFDDAPMPYSQFFDGGQALHGSRLMMDPYVGHSHGCVNFWTEDAGQLWRLTSDKRLRVHVYGAWD